MCDLLLLPVRHDHAGGDVGRSGGVIHADVKHNDHEDEDDVAHEPNVDLLEVAGLGQVLKKHSNV